MSYPGSNILNQAMRVISRQNFTYYPFAERTVNSVGVFQPTYGQPVPAQGSAQPVPKRLYEQMGLDLTKTYFNFYVPQSVIDINRDVSSDYFVFQGNTYTCESITPWFGIDGWVQVLAILVPTAN